MDKPVSFELAILLKAKGFEQDAFKHINKVTMEGTLVFPSIAEVIMWLYEKHNIWISINNLLPRNEKRFEGYVSKVILPPYDPKNLSQFLHLTELYSSPTEACEAAIEFVLEKCI